MHIRSQIGRINKKNMMYLGYSNPSGGRENLRRHILLERTRSTSAIGEISFYQKKMMALYAFS